MARKGCMHGSCKMRCSGSCAFLWLVDEEEEEVMGTIHDLNSMVGFNAGNVLQLSMLILSSRCWFKLSTRLASCACVSVSVSFALQSNLPSLQSACKLALEFHISNTASLASIPCDGGFLVLPPYIQPVYLPANSTCFLLPCWLPTLTVPSPNLHKAPLIH